MAILTENDAGVLLDKLIEILCLESVNQDIKSFSLEKKSFDEKKLIYQRLLMTRELKPVPFEFFKLQTEFLEYINSNRKLISIQNRMIKSKDIIIYQLRKYTKGSKKSDFI